MSKNPQAASLPHPTAGSTGTGDSFISEALAWAANMRLAAVAGCNFGAKTHELSWHSVTCRFRAFEEGAALLEEAASTPAQSVLVEALHKISNPFDHGHCGTCGKECAGATDCDCSFPVWEQDNPIAIAKAALSHAP